MTRYAAEAVDLSVRIRRDEILSARRARVGLARNFTFRGVQRTSWSGTLRISTRRLPSERSFRVNRRRLLTQIRSQVVDLFSPRRNGCTRYINFLRFDRFLRESSSDTIARFRNSSSFFSLCLSLFLLDTYGDSNWRNSVVRFLDHSDCRFDIFLTRQLFWKQFSFIRFFVYNQYRSNYRYCRSSVFDIRHLSVMVEREIEGSRSFDLVKRMTEAQTRLSRRWQVSNQTRNSGCE